MGCKKDIDPKEKQGILHLLIDISTILEIAKQFKRNQRTIKEKTDQQEIFEAAYITNLSREQKMQNIKSIKSNHL